MALYNILKRMIEMGDTEGLSEKIDIFYAVGKLTEAQYKELTEMLDVTAMPNAIDYMTVAELTDYAATNGIDIAGLKLKADIVDAIKTAERGA